MTKSPILEPISTIKSSKRRARQGCIRLVNGFWIERNPKSEPIEKKIENRHEFFTRRVKELGLLDKDSDYDGMLGKAVLELSEVFGKQGHSGFSANATRSIFNQLMDEWENPSPIVSDKLNVKKKK